MANVDASARTDGATLGAIGIAAGIVGAIIAGVVIQFGFDASILSDDIPGGFGLSGLVAGWVIFLLIGAILGLVFAALGQIGPLTEYMIQPRVGTALGLIYGIILWIIAIIIVPLWMGDGSDAIGNYAMNSQGILAFALLGSVIGVVYARAAAP